ncbi:MAG: DUF1007 family protein [Alphaproteobacteria bacterium]|nr:DUF1007 family protein [Alphaproteobacteria bacterium]
MPDLRLPRFGRLTRLRAVGLGLAAAVGLNGSAAAHPHVWVTNGLVLVVEGGAVTRLRHAWTFDEFFSESIIGQYDADGSDTLTGDEITAVHDGAFVSVADFGYFTRVRIGAADVAFGPVEAFTASVENGVLVYQFDLPLVEPIAPGTEVTIGVYDVEYYVEFMPTELGVTIEGAAEGACDTDLFEDEANAIYFGMVAPFTVRVTCAAEGS